MSVDQEGLKVADMVEIINWLAGVEERASLFYAKASTFFAEDKTLSSFLSLLAEEEAEHQKMLMEAAAQLTPDLIPQSCFSLDDASRQKIEKPFARAQVLIARGELTKEAMIEVIAEAEFSEWNELFLYVVDALKEHGREFQKAVAEIEKHRADIEKFIADFPLGNRILAKIGRLNPVWERHILVVEDDPAVANLIKSLFLAEAKVFLAGDGEEGLACIREGYFDVVVSDVEMPKMNGIELYKRALEVDPDLKGRFVFFTGSYKSEYRNFIKSAQLTVLPKPSPLSAIRRAINGVAARKVGS